MFDPIIAVAGFANGAIGLGLPTIDGPIGGGDAAQREATRLPRVKVATADDLFYRAQ
jgi:hypothetical protein